MEISKDSPFPDKLDTGELTPEQLEKLEQEARDNAEEKPKEEVPYAPYLATGIKKFKEGDSLDPRIRTDSDGRTWVKLKDND